MDATIDRRATRVARRLHHDRQFMRRFRAAPHDVLAEAGLTPAQAGAVLSGRPIDLVAAGIDPRKVDRAPLGMLVRSRLVTVFAAATAILAGPLMTSPAAAVRARADAFGIRYIRADARLLRASDVRAIAARRFARNTVRHARFILGPGNGCEKGCIEVEIVP